MKNPMQLQGRTAVAQPVVFMLTEAAFYITGQHLSVNGGLVIGL